jgi:hypothetical protein
MAGRMRREFCLLLHPFILFISISFKARYASVLLWCSSGQETPGTRTREVISKCSLYSTSAASMADRRDDDGEEEEEGWEGYILLWLTDAETRGGEAAGHSSSSHLLCFTQSFNPLIPSSLAREHTADRVWGQVK